MYTATSSIRIAASPAKVWDALTNPDLIRQYLFGTTAVSDWTEGSTLIYKGEWEGKPYEDHGIIKEVVPEKRLVTTYWSAAFGPDIPENYKTVTYEITPDGEGSLLTITQDNNSSEEQKKHSEGNWNVVGETMKKLLEPTPTAEAAQ
jgi:uncharacterized protein YndB with AHSA1/START domain